MSAPWNGLPDQPERIGWHWLKHPNGNYPQPFEWIPDTRQWVVDIDGEGFPEEMADSGYQYICRCPYPSELAQMLKGEREIAASIAQRIGEEWNHTELSPANVGRQIAAAIRSPTNEEGKKS